MSLSLPRSLYLSVSQAERVSLFCHIIPTFAHLLARSFVHPLSLSKYLPPFSLIPLSQSRSPIFILSPIHFYLPPSLHLLLFPYHSLPPLHLCLPLSLPLPLSLSLDPSPPLSSSIPLPLSPPPTHPSPPPVLLLVFHPNMTGVRDQTYRWNLLDLTPIHKTLCMCRWHVCGDVYVCLCI